ncbi:hypothetical protein B0H17DRAFT_1194634 [Mycena rosella]|uniref:F-box domain-containing protein n=1 Tax=Mycena rosella TaxID=1033263 RepID=A0AAD7E182_MYCRO|nr:hypothetical protein B0H17DRAFT_1194634 [Mycena rosella]
MIRIPQELVDAIVDGVAEARSMKSCALVASKFRNPSQRILLRSLTIKCGYKEQERSNYGALSSLLSESPHIAQHVKRLTLKLPAGQKDLQDVEILQRVLARMTRVKHCSINGTYIRDTRWSTLSASLASAVLDFITRQGLHSLAVACLEDLPNAVLLRLMTFVPRISLSYVLRGEHKSTTIADFHPYHHRYSA